MCLSGRIYVHIFRGFGQVNFISIFGTIWSLTFQQGEIASCSETPPHIVWVAVEEKSRVAARRLSVLFAYLQSNLTKEGVKDN